MNHWTRACHRNLVRLALGAMACAVSVATATAAEYHEVAAGDDYIMIVDKSSIYQTGDYMRGWVVTMYADPEADYPIISTLDEFDCPQHRWRALSYTTRDDDGDSIDSFDNDDLSWTNIEPSTNGESLQTAICSSSSITDEAFPTDNLADILSAYLENLDDK